MEDRLDYRTAGVNIELAEQAIKRTKDRIRATHTPRVLGRYGAFSGLFDLKGLGKDPVLVASCDGVGTKLKLAFRTGIHNTVGQDLVNHCVNDIVCCGARPLFFLDYLGIEKLAGEVFEGLIEGLSLACRQNGLALLGGETAELPGMYLRGEYDLAGTIIGCVERDGIVDGSRIQPGDAIIGLSSTGLHTNGYSLALKALLERAKLDLNEIPEGCSRTLAEELMAIHRSYGPWRSN
jgi:phosphoribosylformylglycinamidine cyclo-ligase